MEQFNEHGGGIDREGEFVGVLHVTLSLDGVEHGGALVYQQLAAQVGLLLELLDEELVGTGIEAPVDIARALTGVVLPIVGEFGRKTVERAAMATRNKTLDHLPCKKVEGLVT